MRASRLWALGLALGAAACSDNGNVVGTGVGGQSYDAPSGGSTGTDPGGVTEGAPAAQGSGGAEPAAGASSVGTGGSAEPGAGGTSAASGGTSSTPSGGTSTGGTSTGGTSAGGTSTGGTSAGGTSAGGTSTGGTSAGGTSAGGTGIETGGTASGGVAGTGGEAGGTPADPCTSNANCETGQYCSLPDYSCSGTGTCTLIPEVCPANYNPVCGCDAVTYGNACAAAVAGVNVGAATACGSACTTNEDCGSSQYCSHPPYSCSGTGTCAELPGGCITVVDPVCGCDGVDYGNSCEAALDGVSVRHAGTCVTGFSCGGITGATCSDTEYCAFGPDDACGAGDIMAACEPRPALADCTEQYDPVCGCDRTTYDNECLAHQAGTGILNPGPCAVCVVGQDQTCNDDPVISSLHGVCQADGTCLCNEGFAKNPDTGLCL